MDNTEAMIDEWYPSLRDFSVATGKKLVTFGTLCPHCPVDKAPYCFQLKDLENKSLEIDELICPVHKRIVFMEQLVLLFITSQKQNKNHIARMHVQLQCMRKKA